MGLRKSMDGFNLIVHVNTRYDLQRTPSQKKNCSYTIQVAFFCDTATERNDSFVNDFPCSLRNDSAFEAKLDAGASCERS